MLELPKGGNAEVPATAVRVTASWSTGPRVPDVDVCALLLRADGKVGSDTDFVFFNQPAHPTGTVRHTGKASGAVNLDRLEADLARVPAPVETIVIAASSDGGPFGSVPGLRLTVADAGTGLALLGFDITAGPETAIVAGELYRRGGTWKLRAVGQGYADGLAGLARDYGITVDDTPAAPAPAPPAPPAPAPPAPPAPAPAPTAPAGIDWLNPPVPAGYEI